MAVDPFLFTFHRTTADCRVILDRFSINTSFPPDFGWHVEERPSLEPQDPWARVEATRVINNFGAITVNLGSGQPTAFYRIVVGAP